MDRFVGKFEPEKPFKGNDGGEKYRQGGYESQEHPRAAFAAMMTLLDDQVGEIVQKIKDLGLEKNTIFIFTSDNGPHKEGGANPGFFNSNADFKGHKRDLNEGGIRVPMIVKWEGSIKKGTSSDHISAFWDVFPTISELLQQETPQDIDGVSFLPTLLGKPKNQKQHPYLYWEFHELGGRQAIRKGNWKLIKYDVKNGGDYSLFDLSVDPSETKNLISEMPEISKELIQILENARTSSEYFNFSK